MVLAGVGEGVDPVDPPAVAWGRLIRRTAAAKRAAAMVRSDVRGTPNAMRFSSSS